MALKNPVVSSLIVTSNLAKDHGNNVFMCLKQQALMIKIQIHGTKKYSVDEKLAFSCYFSRTPSSIL